MLIGLAGRAGSGKDTVGAILRMNHGFTLVSFAYPIKEMICGLLGVPMSQWEDREWREKKLPIFDRSPRYLAQTIGTEWGRNCVSPDLWLNLALVNVEDFGRLAITDVRFDNEAKQIQWLGGVIIQVNRLASDGADIGHDSEVGIKDISDVIVLNNYGTVIDLSKQVAEAVKYAEKLGGAKGQL